jgi:hypothetical protein
MIARLLRIAAVLTALPILFEISQRVGEAQGNPPLPGILVALGVLSFLFLVRAAVSEAAGVAVSTPQKDLLWGLGIGGVVTILGRVLGITG